MIRRTIAGLVGYFLKWKILTRRTPDGDLFLFSFYLHLFNIGGFGNIPDFWEWKRVFREVAKIVFF